MNTNDTAETEVAQVNRLRDNNDEHIADEGTQQFRDFVIDAPQPPWRLKIDPPLEYDGTHYAELIFDYDGLIAKDFVRAERTFNRIYKPDKNETAVLPEMHHDYHIILAAQTANVPIGVIYKLPRRYYVPVRLEAVKACGSSPDEEKA